MPQASGPGKGREHLPGRSPTKSPRRCPNVPSACGDRGSWPSPPKLRAKAGWRLPGRSLPHS